MRRRTIGIILLLVGVGGFIWANGQLAGYDSFEGSVKVTFAQSERSRKQSLATGRWVALALGVAGLALAALPDRKG